MRRFRSLLLSGAAMTAAVLLVPTAASATPPSVAKTPTAVGTGGAVSIGTGGAVSIGTGGAVSIGTGGAVATVDADATAAGVRVLRQGGNAVDAAVAAAGVLGVTEPYSSGLGGGGFFAYYDAKTKQVSTIDGRETAPAAYRRDTLTEGGVPIPFLDAVTSGLSNGVPGTPATWAKALRQWGTWSLGEALAPGAQLAQRGFVVDQTFQDQTAQNVERFNAFPATRRLFLPGGHLPVVGSRLTNPDLARTYAEIARHGVGTIYGGPIGADIVKTTQHPPVDPASPLTVRPGLMTLADLRSYTAPNHSPTQVSYHGLDVYGVAPPSSGGTTIGESLNILENFDLRAMSNTQYFQHYLEATRLAFADRNRYVGDPSYVDVPRQALLSQGFARERACLIDPHQAGTSPAPPGNPDGSYRACRPAHGVGAASGHEGINTTNMTVADRWGNVVEYTLTIEQTGGSAITVPGRGFLLNNELTDFDFVPLVPGVPDPNLPAAGKRPRSSMAPTIVLRGGTPYLAVGSPGGSTIITTVLQILLGRLDRGLTLPQAIAAPRAAQRDSTTTTAEPEFIARYGPALESLGQAFALQTPDPAIGAATGIEFLGHGRLLAAAEPTRRGGGAAAVVHPR